MKISITKELFERKEEALPHILCAERSSLAHGSIIEYLHPASQFWLKFVNHWRMGYKGSLLDYILHMLKPFHRCGLMTEASARIGANFWPVCSLDPDMAF
jgi:hypothetical protein